MKIGLKQNLYSEIQQRGVITYEEAEQIAKNYGYKVDNMTRRMRELMESGSVEPILTPKKHISGYRFIGKHEGVQIFNQRQGNLI